MSLLIFVALLLTFTFHARPSPIPKLAHLCIDTAIDHFCSFKQSDVIECLDSVNHIITPLHRARLAARILLCGSHKESNPVWELLEPVLKANLFADQSNSPSIDCLCGLQHPLDYNCILSPYGRMVVLEMLLVGLRIWGWDFVIGVLFDKSTVPSRAKMIDYVAILILKSPQPSTDFRTKGASELLQIEPTVTEAQKSQKPFTIALSRNYEILNCDAVNVIRDTAVEEGRITIHGLATAQVLMFTKEGHLLKQKIFGVIRIPNRFEPLDLKVPSAAKYIYLTAKDDKYLTALPHSPQPSSSVTRKLIDWFDWAFPPGSVEPRLTFILLELIEQ